MSECQSLYIFFFFNDTATTEIYTLSLHDALPIYFVEFHQQVTVLIDAELPGLLPQPSQIFRIQVKVAARSEEHTSELQSQSNLVCRLLLEKKKQTSLLSTPCAHSRVASIVLAIAT